MVQFLFKRLEHFQVTMVCTYKQKDVNSFHFLISAVFVLSLFAF